MRTPGAFEPADFAHHACVGTAPPLPWHSEWRVGDASFIVRPSVQVNSSESLRAAAIAGLGLVAAPDWLVADALAAGQLTCVLADFATPSSGIYAVYPTNRLMIPVVREFVDHLIVDLRARGVAR